MPRKAAPSMTGLLKADRKRPKAKATAKPEPKAFEGPGRGPKVTVYLDPDLMEQVEVFRAKVRVRSGRGASYTGLVSAALRMALDDPDSFAAKLEADRVKYGRHRGE